MIKNEQDKRKYNVLIYHNCLFKFYGNLNDTNILEIFNLDVNETYISYSEATEELLL